MPQTDPRLPLKERCLEALEFAPLTATSTELEIALTSLDQTINETFLHSANSH